MRSSDYTAGEDDVVPCVAFSRHDLFWLIELGDTRGFRLFLYEGCIKIAFYKGAYPTILMDHESFPRIYLKVEGQN